MTTETLVHRSLLGARTAYERGDASLSRAAHSLTSEPVSPKLAPLAAAGWLEDGHNEEGIHHGASLVLRGAVEGTVLSTVVLSAADAVGWAPSFSVNVCLVTLASWVVFAALREALEVATYSTHYARERQRERWELENFPEGEIAEMVQLYVQKGLDEKSARTAVEAMASAKDFFVDVMMLEELQMAPVSSISAVQSALRIGVSCLVCGAVPPLFSALFATALSPAYAHALTLAVAFATLAYIGARRAMITHLRKRWLALQTAALLVPVVALTRAGSHLLLASSPQ